MSQPAVVKPKEYDKTLVLLRFGPETKNPDDQFHIVVIGYHWLNKDGTSRDPVGENDRYYYEESTCPWNFLQVPTFFRGDSDYHGIFKHVKTILVPSVATLYEMFPEWVFNDDHDSDHAILSNISELTAEQADWLFFPEHHDGEVAKLHILSMSQKPSRDITDVEITEQLTLSKE